ncbi:MAG: SCO family protein [Devosiaceae bacterium]|nr:SCO family protein [Devosiaceae bacterium]
MATNARSGLSRLRLILWGMVLISGVAATLFYLISPPKPTAIGFGSPFTLTATDGSTFTQDDLKGTPSLVFFGYTFCPDVCPTTLFESTGWRAALDLTEEDLRIIFVSVDPDRDTPESIGEYLTAFSSPVIGLTGTQAQIDNTKQVFSVFSEKVDDAGASDYLVNHTASVFMLNKDGGFIGTISYEEDTQTAISKVQRLVNLD